MTFDTDLIGSYGICVDISRTWWIGDRAPRANMVSAMQHAHEHIMENMSILKPGVRMRDFSLNAHKLGDQYKNGKYGCLTHGVDLCDERPLIEKLDRLVGGAFNY